MRIIAESILSEIKILHKDKQRLLIAIDGRCAAGKTTLAAHLQGSLACNVIHMDHFFLRREQRTAERLNEPGGNTDYERFLDEALIPLKQGRNFSYRPYNCRCHDFSKAISVQACAVTIIEGTYSCHPTLRDHYDLRIFLTIDPEEQLHRIQQRNGATCAINFKCKWIPLEEQYILCYQVQEHSDLHYKS